ncbi:hypothetical protein EDC19_0541 [Natranaerovirga hydrolytica]|uniref:Uncharacterized protein n=1 Tax=Natranaerovirga hydrolytica TaxID=680378 RepID=A0A4R1N668_9FIRM|nr:hypothetical protein [Natranaerovirga hydrolytica]TCK98123.1 hypothetical protein EDC19_0541 [Natranaerovirga hydrolytica]
MRIRNKKLLLFVLAMLAFTLSTNLYAQTITTNNPYFSTNTVETTFISKSDEYIAVPFRDIIEWRYKAVDGELYRRQYNYSKQKWIGEWELC